MKKNEIDKAIDEAMNEFANAIAEGLMELRGGLVKALKALDAREISGEAAREIKGSIDYIDEFIFVIVDKTRTERGRPWVAPRSI